MINNAIRVLGFRLLRFFPKLKPLSTVISTVEVRSMNFLASVSNEKERIGQIMTN